MSERPWWRLSDRDARRLSLALAIGCVLLLPWLCGEPSPPVPPGIAPEVAVAPSASAARDTGDPADDPADDPGVVDCDDLAAREDPEDAALVPWLCPGRPLSALQARAALLSAESPTRALALRPSLHGHAELQAWIDLVAGAAAAMPEGELPRPELATVSPVTPEVLGWARAAERALVEPGLDHETRTRARALLAKIHMQVLLRLGVEPESALPPFGRRVAALSLHHGRTFCEAHWRRRVAGLPELFAQTEVELSRTLQALDRTPFFADDALLSDEREATRAYLSGAGAKRRVAAARADGWSGPGEARAAQLERLVGAGTFDLAVDRAVVAASEGDPAPGLKTLEQLLLDAAARQDRPEAGARIRDRLDRVRARAEPPTEDGTGTMEPPVWPWPSAEHVAAEATAWIERAAIAQGFARRHATARALAVLRARPDAAERLLRISLATGAPPELREAAEWIAEELRARDPGRPADLGPFAATQAGDPDRARRLQFAADVVP